MVQCNTGRARNQAGRNGRLKPPYLAPEHRVRLAYRVGRVVDEIDHRRVKVQFDGEAQICEVEKSDLEEEDGSPLKADKENRTPQVESLLDLVESAYRFHDSLNQSYIVIRRNGHEQVMPVRSRDFKRWLISSFHSVCGRSPSPTSLNTAIDLFDAQAWNDGPREEVFIRIEGDDDRIYIDMGDETWKAVEITGGVWRVRDRPPVRFRRPDGMKPLALPQRVGTISLLRRHVNCSDEQFKLLVVWLTAALRPKGPYPVLALVGEQGSAKSTLARLLRCLIDPHVVPIRCKPKDERDMMISCYNSWILVYDNVSHLESWLSDALCRLATGGGLATRSLYTNQDETLFDAQRPVILNGISDYVSRDDLTERCIFMHLPAISNRKRRSERSFWLEFQQNYSLMLGAIYDVLSGAMAILPKVNLSELPRMADFAQWGVAVERFLQWEDGTFLEAYDANQCAANASALDDSPVATALVKFLTEGSKGTVLNPWVGTASQLLTEIRAYAGEEAVKPDRWPKSGKGMSSALRRLAPALRRTGINLNFDQRTNSARPITIWQAPDEESFQGSAAIGDGLPTAQTGSSPYPSPVPPYEFSVSDHGDGSDEPIPPF
jgi:hypothetical protein